MVFETVIGAYLSVAGRLTLGLIFAFSGGAKLMDIPRFLKVVEDFRILPLRSVRVFALIVIFVEVALSCFLILGIAVELSLIVLLMLLSLFSVALVHILIEGRQVECRCFGGLSRGPASWGSVARNLLLAVLGIGTLLSQVGSTQRTLERIDFMLVGLLVLSAVAVIALVSEAGALLAGPAGARSGR